MFKAFILIALLSSTAVLSETEAPGNAEAPVEKVAVQQNNADEVKEIKGLFNIAGDALNTLRDAAKDTLQEGRKSVKDAITSLKDAGKQTWETTKQLGKTGLDINSLIPKFGLKAWRGQQAEKTD